MQPQLVGWASQLLHEDSQVLQGVSQGHETVWQQGSQVLHFFLPNRPPVAAVRPIKTTAVAVYIKNSSDLEHGLYDREQTIQVPKSDRIAKI